MNGSNKTNALTRLLYAIAVIGALNWGLIGLFNWNLVDAILGGGSAEQTSSSSRVLYTVVGLAGLAALFILPRLRLTRGRAAPRAART